MRRRLSFALIIILESLLLLSGMSLAFEQRASASQVATGIESYKDIPGVTEAEIDSIEALRERYPKFVYGMNETAEAFMYPNGNIGGFVALFAQRLGQLFGVPFEVRNVSWEELVTGMENGQVHFTSELTPTPERMDHYYMSKPILARFVKSFQNKNSDNLNMIMQSRTPRLGFFKGSTTETRVIKTLGGPCTIVSVDSYEQAAEMLFDGRIDAFFDENTAEAAFDKYEYIRIDNYYPILYSSVAFSTVDPALAVVVSVLDKYLSMDGSSDEISKLYNQGHYDYTHYKTDSMLTREEKAYIALHSFTNNAVKLVVERDNYPVCFYNEQEKQFQGIAIDVIDAISNMTGLKFQMVGKPENKQAELVAMLEDGRAAMMAELIRSEEREDRFIWTDVPYATDYYALISLVDQPDIDINEMLYAKIGMIIGTGYEEVFHQWFPENKNTIDYPSNERAFEALERREVGYIMASQNLLLSLTNYLENPSFKANLVFKSSYDSMFGFNKEEKVLRSIIAKVQSGIDTVSITDRWTRKTFDYRSKLVQARMPYMIGLAVLLLGGLVFVVIMLFKNRRMSRNLEELVLKRTEQLELRTEEAQVANRTKSDFLARMSHEIRTPLNAIIGMTQVAQRDVEDPKKAKNSLNRIQIASSHLLDILNDVLDMSKIEAGKFEVASEPFSLDAAMREVSSIIGQRCTDRGVIFDTNTGEVKETSVIGDRMRLKQILINLLGNAVKFTNAGGTVSFTIALYDQPDNRVRIQFTVADTGIGMTQEQMSKLFTAFEQADSSIAGRFGGTGLGLVISQNLVRKMGGEIKVRSRIGEGSTFSFELDMEASDYREHDRSEKEMPSLDLSNKRILLVEDVELNRIVLSELLSETHVTIDEAEDGVVALEMFEASPLHYYDLVFMDIQMPRLNGYKATTALRELDREDAKKIPIIAMTANAYSEDIEKALSVGMNGHLAKPIDIELVIRALLEWIGS